MSRSAAGISWPRAVADAAALPVPLADGVVHLEPLDESHRTALRAACADDDDFWPIYPRDFRGPSFDASFDEMQADPQRLPFALFAGGVLVGMSGYLDVDAASHVLQIGGTYLTKTARGTGVNARYKRLLIDHAIACGFRRIEFRIDTRNARSMAAVEKLGAVKEGVMRRQRVTWTGHVRDTALYSLLAGEWRG